VDETLCSQLTRWTGLRWATRSSSSSASKSLGGRGQKSKEASWRSEAGGCFLCHWRLWSMLESGRMSVTSD